ncbi:MAG: hypothetical protein KF754_14650 [Planctomycetes bacterium]|nr:hypothetical protein [Planctomycetota bacterium]
MVRFNGTPLASPGHTFLIAVTNLNLTGAPAAGLPTQSMLGFTMSQPSLVVAIPSVTARPVTSYYTGPGSDGFEYVRFTITNNSPVPVTLNNIRLYGYSATSSYLGNITSVELFEDTNQSGAWERTGDTKVGNTYATWTSFQDFTYIGGAGAYAGNESRQYLVVVKLNGSTVPPNGSQLGFYVSSSSTATGATISGSTQVIYYGVQIQNASLHTLATQGAAVSLPGTYATGKEVGTFTIRNTSTGTSVNLNSITLQASGTGNDLTGYSLLALYRDTNSSGVYDTGDTLYGASSAGFASDNGTRVFTQTLAIAGNAIETFFVVAALNGTTTPTAGQTFKTRVSAITSSVASDSLGLASAIMEGIVCTGTNPTLVATPMSLNLGSTLVGVAGTAASYQLQGFNTTNATDITAPTGVEVSFTAGSGYAASLNIASTGNWGPTTIFARIASTASVGAITGNITNVSTGANSPNVAVNGSVTPAGLNTTPTSLNLGTTPVGVAGTAFSYTVSGTGTINPTDITAPSGVQVSFSQTTGFAGSIQITTTGTWGPTTVWARLTGASVGGVSGNITHVSTGASSANVSVTGTVVQPAVTASTASINLGTTPLGTPGTAINYTVSGSNTTNVTDLTPPTGVEISFSQTTGFAGSLQITSTGTWGPTTIWARLIGSTAGAVSGNITHISTGATSANVAVSGTVTPPTIGTSTSTLNLGSTPLGTPGTAINYTVSGSGMTNGTDLTAPAGVEISFSQTTGFAATLNIATTGTWGPTTIWARLTGTTAGVFSGNITHVSTGATTVNVSISGNTYSLVANPTTLNLGTTVVGTPGTPQSYTLTGEGLTSATTVTAPSGIELCLTVAGTYTPTLNINQTPSLSATVFARLIGTTLGSYGGNITNVAGPASENVAVSGDVVTPDNLDASRNGPGSSTTVNNNAQGAGGNGLVILDVTVATTNTAWTVTSFVFSASGSADEQTALDFLALYEDSTTGGTQGSFDGPATDVLATAAAGVSFNAANGTYTATLVNGAWAASTSRRFFLVAKLAGTAQAGETIHAELTTINATTGGTGVVTGVPTSSATPALTIDAAVMTATLNGPMAFTTVDNNSQGAGGNGHVVADVTLSTINDSWTVSSLTFTESGTMDGQTDLNFLALYLDNGNGVWDGPTIDTLATATAGTAFSAPNGTYTATLTAGPSAFAVNQSKRFFLVARLSGQASPGETLRVELTSINESSPTGGTVAGAPTAATSALVIDVATLTVNAGPANPTTITVEQTAAAFQRMIGQFRFTASNDDFVVTGLTLTLGGNGDWVNNLNATSGVELYRDNGNGTFDGTDTLVFSGAGGVGTVVAAFSASQTVNMGTSMDLWLVLNVLATAGGSPAEVFNAQIASGAAVSTTTSGNVLIGTVAPVSADLRVVTFSVTNFTPLLALPAGGTAITITGTGFALPVTLTINGVICPGTPSVNAGGTQITGLLVPVGSGTNLPIVLNTNNLGPKTLTQTFSYSTVTTGGSGGGGGGGGGGCSAGMPVAPLALLAPTLIALFGLRRRRKN